MSQPVVCRWVKVSIPTLPPRANGGVTCHQGSLLFVGGHGVDELPAGRVHELPLASLKVKALERPISVLADESKPVAHVPGIRWQKASTAVSAVTARDASPPDRTYFSLHTITDAACVEGPLPVMLGNSAHKSQSRMPAAEEVHLQIHVLPPDARSWLRTAPHVASTAIADKCDAMPVARVGAASCAAKSRVFVFGGSTSRSHVLRREGAPVSHAAAADATLVYLNDVFYVTFAPGSCETLAKPTVKLCNQTTGSPPSARTLAQVCLLGHHMVVHGGFNESGPLADVHVLHMTPQVWSSPRVGGIPLPPRMRGVAIGHGRTHMIVFGGKTRVSGGSSSGGGGSGGRGSSRDGSGDGRPPSPSTVDMWDTCVLSWNEELSGVVASRVPLEDQLSWGSAVTPANAHTFMPPEPAAGCQATILPHRSLTGTPWEALLLEYNKQSCGAAAETGSGFKRTRPSRSPARSLLTRTALAEDWQVGALQASTLVFVFGGARMASGETAANSAYLLQIVEQDALPTLRPDALSRATRLLKEATDSGSGSGGGGGSSPVIHKLPHSPLRPTSTATTTTTSTTAAAAAKGRRGAARYDSPGRPTHNGRNHHHDDDYDDGGEGFEASPPPLPKRKRLLAAATAADLIADFAHTHDADGGADHDTAGGGGGVGKGAPSRSSLRHAPAAATGREAARAGGHSSTGATTRSGTNNVHGGSSEGLPCGGGGDVPLSDMLTSVRQTLDHMQTMLPMAAPPPTSTLVHSALEPGTLALLRQMVVSTVSDALAPSLGALNALAQSVATLTHTAAATKDTVVDMAHKREDASRGLVREVTASVGDLLARPSGAIERVSKDVANLHTLVAESSRHLAKLVESSDDSRMTQDKYHELLRDKQLAALRQDSLCAEVAGLKEELRLARNAQVESEKRAVAGCEKERLALERVSQLGTTLSELQGELAVTRSELESTANAKKGVEAQLGEIQALLSRTRR